MKQPTTRCLCDPSSMRWQRLRVEEKAPASAAQARWFLPFSVLPTCSFSIYSSAAFWKANLTGESFPFLKLDRWIIMINATPLLMSIRLRGSPRSALESKPQPRSAFGLTRPCHASARIVCLHFCCSTTPSSLSFSRGPLSRCSASSTAMFSAAMQSDTPLDLLQPDSASDQQFFASDPPGVFGRQEQRGLGDVFTRAHASQRRSRDCQLLKAILVLRH